MWKAGSRDKGDMMAYTVHCIIRNAGLLDGSWEVILPHFARMCSDSLILRFIWVFILYFVLKPFCSTSIAFFDKNISRIQAEAEVVPSSSLVEVEVGVEVGV